MIILGLELIGYKRLMLSNIHHFIYTPEAAYQLILGTNGSGKSSILHELSPLPAKAADFVKDGSKTITVSHRNSLYVLTSTFRTGNKHSFVKDGYEFNDGGTGRVQEELVAKEFGLTPELHELLTGQTLFTELPPLKRRDWCTKLSTADYRFALNLYQKLKVSARDSQGALKHVKKRLLDETHALHNLVDAEGVDERVSWLHDEITRLLYTRISNAPEYQGVRERLERSLVRLQVLADDVVKDVIRAPRAGAYTSTESIREVTQALAGKIQSTNERLTHFTTEYSELESVLKSLGSQDGTSIENIETALLEAEQALDLATVPTTHFHDFKDAKAMLRDTNEVIAQVMDLFQKLPDNSDRRYGREALEAAKKRLQEVQALAERSKLKASQAEGRIEMIRTAATMECPSCRYVWKPGYSEAELEQLTVTMDQYTANIIQTAAEIKQLETYLEDSENYAGLYRAMRGFVNAYPRLAPLWDYILENKLMTDSPQSHIDVFYTWMADVEKAAGRVSAQEHFEQLQDLARRQAHAEGQHFTLRLAKLHDSIERTTSELEEYRREHKLTKANLESMQALEAKILQLEDLVSEVDSDVRSAMDGLSNSIIDQSVKQHQTELGAAQHKLNERIALEGVVTDLNKSHDALTDEHQAWQLLVKAMSPEEGLIADQLRNSIGCLVAQVNSIIASIWTYDMTVMSCSVDMGELDYKFPLQIRSVDNQVPDIKFGSKAQCEVVNFAFQLTAMMYLELENFPLCLDELGASFDEQHRQNLIGFIKQLMDNQRHSQLFMVSHYTASWGSFPGAQYLVLDGSNIAVPSEHNQHATLH